PAIIVAPQLLFVLGKVIAHFLRDEIMFVGQAETFAGRIHKFCAGFSMRFVRPFDLGNTFADERMRNDKLRSSVVALPGDVEGIEKLLHVLAIDFLNVESVRFETLSSVFALSFLGRGIKGDGIRIVDEDQIIEAEMSGKSARFGRNPFLHVAIAREADDMLIENLVLAGVETSSRHLCCHGYPDCVTDALPEWPCRAFDS